MPLAGMLGRKACGLSGILDRKREGFLIIIPKLVKEIYRGFYAGAEKRDH